MLIKHTFKTALKGLKANRPRSALTILGIVIGIAAIILVMSLGRGARDLILSQIQGMGSKVIAVVPGREPKGPTDIIQTFSDSLKEKDLAALKRKTNVPTLSEIMPVVFGGMSASFQGETYWLTVFGGSDLIMQIFDLYPEEGVFLTKDDVDSRANAVVIGAKVKEKLFGSSEAVGQNIKLKGRNFRVIGVLPKKGQFSFFNFDDAAIVPYTAAQQYIFGIKYFNRFIAEAESESAVAQTARDIETTLRNSHNIADPDKDDFFVETQADAIERVSTIMNIMTLFLAAVAAISLLVGGIGIMNIMLVSVTERTREIGLRKALGATDKDILSQFLIEAVLLTAIGGLIGVFLGAVLSFASSIILSRVLGLGWSFAFPVSAVVLGLGVSASVGLVFGLYPARQASLKSPIEALRYE
mgnify:CR=1 FL=1